jgi:hypothetical protein
LCSGRFPPVTSISAILGYSGSNRLYHREGLYPRNEAFGSDKGPNSEGLDQISKDSEITVLATKVEIHGFDLIKNVSAFLQFDIKPGITMNHEIKTAPLPALETSKKIEETGVLVADEDIDVEASAIQDARLADLHHQYGVRIDTCYQDFLSYKCIY